MADVRFTAVPIASLSASQQAVPSSHRENSQEFVHCERLLSLRGCRCGSDVQQREQIPGYQLGAVLSTHLYWSVIVVVAKYLCHRDRSRYSLSFVTMLSWINVPNAPSLERLFEAICTILFKQGKTDFTGNKLICPKLQLNFRSTI